MKIVRTIEVFNDNDKKLNVGDSVIIKAYDKTCKGTIKAINPQNIAINIEEGKSCSILYKDIESII